MTFKPMKCCDAELEKLKFPLWGEPKIDGVRALQSNHGFTARTLMPFKNRKVTELFSDPAFFGFDGELTVGNWNQPRLCSHTTSLVNTVEGGLSNAYGDIGWWIFDHCKLAPNVPYHTRYQQLSELVSKLPSSCNIQVVPFQVVNNLEELEIFEKQALADGFEGLILRNPLGLYKYGKTTVRENNVLRLKRFTDAEAVVLEIFPAQHNNNTSKVDLLGYTTRSSHLSNKVLLPIVGSLKCQTLDGRIITVAPGVMTNREKEFYFLHPEELVGKLIKYKFFDHGIKDMPRFPTFLSIRCEEDA